MKKYMVMAVFAMIAIMALGMLNTGAWFSDTQTSDVGSITAGRLSINNGGMVVKTIGTIPNMAPGDISDEIVIEIENNGNLDLGWFGNIIFEGDASLKNVLYIDYAKMNFIGWGEPEDNFIADGKGSGPHSDWYDNLAAKSSFGVITLNNFDGTTAMGVAPYEFNGALVPGKKYRLTLKIGMVEEAGNAYQALGPVTIKFQVNATQLTEGAVEQYSQGWDVPAILTWMNKQIAKQQ